MMGQDLLAAAPEWVAVPLARLELMFERGNPALGRLHGALQGRQERAPLGQQEVAATGWADVGQSRVVRVNCLRDGLKGQQACSGRLEMPQPVRRKGHRALVLDSQGWFPAVGALDGHELHDGRDDARPVDARQRRARRTGGAEGNLATRQW